MAPTQQIRIYAVTMNLLIVAGIVSVGIGWPVTAICLLFAASLSGVQVLRLKKTQAE